MECDHSQSGYENGAWRVIKTADDSSDARQCRVCHTVQLFFADNWTSLKAVKDLLTKVEEILQAEAEEEVEEVNRRKYIEEDRLAEAGRGGLRP